MQMLWCWRCKDEMPMLDDDEYQEVWDLLQQAIRSTKEYRLRWKIPLENASMEQRMHPILIRYEQLTGYKETNPNAVFHHQLSLYGPPCERCKRPLRSPGAKLCGACMHPVSQIGQ